MIGDRFSKFNRAVFSLYEAAHVMPMASFQDAALDGLKSSLPFDAAMWGSATMTDQGIDIHTLHLHNTSMQMIDDYQQVKHLDHFAHEVAQHTQKTISFSADCALVGDFQNFLFKHKHFHGLITQHLQPETRFVQWLSLFRHNAQNHCTDDDVALLDMLFPHVMQALAINRKIHMTRLADEGQRAQWAHAIADRHGFLYYADDVFLGLIAQDYAYSQSDRLPNSVIDAISPQNTKLLGLHTVLATRWEKEFLFLRIRPKVLADQLNEREFAIAKMLSDGLTVKDIADQLHRSPDTIRTQSKTIYKKLGVNKVTQLALLLAQRD